MIAAAAMIQAIACSTERVAYAKSSRTKWGIAPVAPCDCAM